MTIRIGGLASGIDTDSMVQKLMQAHRIPLTKLTQKKQTFEWQRDAYRELNTKLTAFRNNSLFNMKLESHVAPKKATVAGGSTAVQVSASPNAQAGSVVLDVQSLAKAASNYGINAIGTEDFAPGTVLAKAFEEGHLTYAGVHNADTDEYEMPETFKFKINGTEITVDTAKDTLNSVITKINRETNVSAFYDSVSGKISLMSKETGSVNGSDDGLTISLEDVEGDFLANVLQVEEGSANEITAADASLYINGMLTSRSSNSFTINGVQITLVKAEPGTPVTINVTNDVDQTVEKIKQFITEYNDMLKYLQDIANQPKYRSFLPLTDEQKKEMSETDITRWETQAKSGLLRNDMILTSAISSMRYGATAVIDTGSADYRSLSSIGIITGNYSEQGKLYLEDETQLRKALEEDPEAVLKLFTATGNGDGNRSDVGIASRLHEDLKNTLDQVVVKAGRFITLADESMLSKQINRVNNDIDAMNRKVAKLETDYYRKFAAFEQAISRYNSQAAYLANAFGGGQQ